MSLARPFRRRPALSVTGSPGPDARAGTGRAAAPSAVARRVRRSQTVACAGLERWASLISGGRARRCSFFSCYLHTIIRFRLRSMYTHSSTIRLVRGTGRGSGQPEPPAAPAPRGRQPSSRPARRGSSVEVLFDHHAPTAKATRISAGRNPPARIRRSIVSFKGHRLRPVQSGDNTRCSAAEPHQRRTRKASETRV